MKIIKSITILLAAAATLCACSEEQKSEEHADATPRLISIVPPKGEVGSSAIISGLNFSTKAEENVVMVGSSEATVVEASRNRLVVTMPQNDPGEYPISLKVGSHELSEGLKYEYVADGSAPMELAAIVPEASFPGNSVAIYGQGFGDNASDISVMFGDIEGQVTFATRNIIHVTVPQRDPGNVLISVSNGAKSADGLRFTFRRVPVFGMTSVSPSSGKAGGTAVITGECFSTNPEENILTINGQRCTIVAATEEKLTFILPENPEGTYEFRLQVGDKVTEGLSFTYLPKGYIMNLMVGTGKNGQVDGVGTKAVISMAQDMHWMPDGKIWMVMRSQHSIRTLDPRTLEVSTLVKDDNALNNVWQGAFNSKNVFYGAVKAKNWLATVSLTGAVSTFTLVDKNGDAYPIAGPMSIAFDKNDVMYVAVRDTYVNGTKGCILKVIGNVVQEAWPANMICTIEMGPDGCLWWGSESNALISKTDPSEGSTVVVAGTGVKPTAAANNFTNGTPGNPRSATINIVRDIAFGSDGTLLFTEEVTATLRKLVPDENGDYTKGTISTVAGIPCTSASAVNNDSKDGLNSTLSNYVYAVLPEEGMNSIWLNDGFSYMIYKLVKEE